MDNKPLISVIMATYNDRPEYIREAMDSIVNQTYGHFELIVLDDSTDEATRGAIDGYCGDERVRVYRSGDKLGFVPSLNRGLELAKGRYIARMDGDDISFPDRFEKQVRYLEAHPDVDILGGQINIINERGEVTGSRRYPLGGIRLAAFFTMRTPVAHPTVMFRRRIVDGGYRYDPSYRKAEDIDFWIRLYNSGFRFANLPDTVFSFRVESDFMEKRVTNHAQEEYVLKARRENLSWRRPLFSVADLAMSYVRQLTPDHLKAKQYEQENENKAEE